MSCHVVIFRKTFTKPTLFIFCGSWISVSWRAARQKLKQQIKKKKKKESRLTKLWSHRNRDRRSGSELFSEEKKSCWQGADLNHSQRLHCFSWGEMSRVVSQFIPWTNEIFWGLFNIPLNDMSKKEEGEPPSQGLLLFYNVLRKWKGFNIAGKVKVTKRGVFSQSWFMSEFKLQENKSGW